MSNISPTRIAKSLLDKTTNVFKGSKGAELEELSCRSCGGKELKREGSRYICQYCGTVYTKSAGDLLTMGNLLERSRSYLENEDIEAANELCEKALDMDAQNPEAVSLMKEIDSTIVIPNVRIKNSENVLAHIFLGKTHVGDVPMGEELDLIVPVGVYEIGADYGTKECEQTTRVVINNRFERYEGSVAKQGFLKPLSIEIKKFVVKKKRNLYYS